MTERRYPRAALIVDRLYHESPTGRFFNTPDGVGVFWYDNYREAMAEVGDFGRPIISIMQELED